MSTIPLLNHYSVTAIIFLWLLNAVNIISFCNLCRGCSPTYSAPLLTLHMSVFVSCLKWALLDEGDDSCLDHVLKKESETEFGLERKRCCD